MKGYKVSYWARFKYEICVLVKLIDETITSINGFSLKLCSTSKNTENIIVYLITGNNIINFFLILFVLGGLKRVYHWHQKKNCMVWKLLTFSFCIISYFIFYFHERKNNFYNFTVYLRRFLNFDKQNNVHKTQNYTRY